MIPNLEARSVGMEMVIVKKLREYISNFLYLLGMLVLLERAVHDSNPLTLLQIIVWYHPLCRICTVLVGVLTCMYAALFCHNLEVSASCGLQCWLLCTFCTF